VKYAYSTITLLTNWSEKIAWTQLLKIVAELETLLPRYRANTRWTSPLPLASVVPRRTSRRASAQLVTWHHGLQSLLHHNLTLSLDLDLSMAGELGSWPIGLHIGALWQIVFLCLINILTYLFTCTNDQVQRSVSSKEW